MVQEPGRGDGDDWEISEVDFDTPDQTWYIDFEEYRERKPLHGKSRWLLWTVVIVWAVAVIAGVGYGLAYRDRLAIYAAGTQAVVLAVIVVTKFGATFIRRRGS